MPSLFLIRSRPLTQKEISSLPTGCFPVRAEDPLFTHKRIIAHANIRAPIPLLLKLAFEMGKAVPDSSFGFEEGFAEEPDVDDPQEQLNSTEGRSKDVLQEEIEESSLEEFLFWHEYVEKREFDKGLDSLEKSLPITQEDQIIISRLFASKDAEKMIFVCRASRRFKWKSMVLKLRVGLRHGEPRVRVAVLQAIGDLAGPSLSPLVQLCSKDPDESVRTAAIKSLRKLKKR